MKPIAIDYSQLARKTSHRAFEFTWYQKYYRLLAKYNVEKLRKYDSKGRWKGKGLEYHHVKPVSIYGNDNNCIVVVPGDVHARLHWLLWKHYEEKGMDREASKMKYAYETLNSKHGMLSFYEITCSEWHNIEKNYKYLVKNYSI